MDEKTTAPWQLTGSDSVLMIDNQLHSIRMLTDDKLALRAMFDGDRETDLFFVK